MSKNLCDQQKDSGTQETSHFFYYCGTTGKFKFARACNWFYHYSFITEHKSHIIMLLFHETEISTVTA
jgi:hypothetical protein